MKILVLDNYDSFTFNLVHLLHKIVGSDAVTVCRNDKISLEAVADYDKILLSPGPGLPKEAGIMCTLIAKYAQEKAILGICLGHQAIAETFGAQLLNIPTVLHGVASKAHILVGDEPLFKQLPKKFNVGHYHSWVIAPDSLGRMFDITAINEQGHIMGIRHKQLNIKGLQFHPESILTAFGRQIIENWLRV